MIGSVVVGTAGFTLGLYAGKRRANGKGWGEITSEIIKGLCSVVSRVWSRIRAQFKKDAPSIVDVEMVESGK